MVKSVAVRTLAAAALVLLLAACSSITRVAYNNATFAATWLVDDWFDLQEDQHDWMKARFEKFRAWHRAVELPAYEHLLKQTALDASTGIGADGARRVHAQLREFYYRSLRRALPDMAEFLLTLRPGQVEYLARRFDEDNAKAVREIVKNTARERLKTRIERYTDRIEDWTGRLTDSQRELLRARIAAMEDISAAWMNDRRTRQKAMIALLRTATTREAMTDGLVHLLVDTDRWRAPAFAASLKARDENAFAMIAALDATLTPEQRARIVRRLDAYAADVAQLKRDLD